MGYLKTVKTVVTNAKIAAFECLYVELGEKDRDKKLYRFARERERERKLA